MQITAYIRSLFMPATTVRRDMPEPCNTELAGRYFRNVAARQTLDSGAGSDTCANGQVISDATAEDLDLDAVFDAIDRTSSRVGQQYLYARMRLLQGADEVAEFGRRTDLFEADPALAARCVKQLRRLKHDDAYDIQNLIFDTPQEIRHIGGVYLLTAGTLLSLAGVFFHPLFLLPFLLFFAVNAFLHYSNKIRVTLCLSSVAQLHKCIRTARALAAEPAIAREYDTSFLDEVGTTDRHSRIVGALCTQGGNDFALVFWFLFELIKIVCNAEIILFHRFVGTITEKRTATDLMFRFVGTIDAAISIAHLKGERDTCRPQFVAEKRLTAEEIVHPLIHDCVPNSLRLDGRGLLLTGSNMSGKTTFIRTLCINALLGETLGICFARSYAAPYFRIYSAIRIGDDVLSGTSYYLAEVLAIREFLKASETAAPCLFALDELFKGTNTTERIAAGKAVLARLNAGNHLVCAATHDTELTGLLDGSYALHHFREEVRDEKLAFDYKLHEGRLKTRNAIRILELYGYPPEVVDDACRTQEKLA